MWQTHASNTASQTGIKDASVGKIAFNNGGPEQELFVEIADSPFERARGLMCRTALQSNWGMLFIMPLIQAHKFWMKNTLIALDMVFIDENWDIVGIVTDVPPLTLQGRGVENASKYVLELGAGEAQRLSLFVGQRLQYSSPE